MIDARFAKRFGEGFSLDVHIQAGSGITAIFGPSAAGKTLLLDLIAGFVKPDGGRLLIGDRILYDAQSRVDIPPRLRKCGYVFQNYALFPHMTVRDNLLFAGQALPGRERHRRANETLERFRIADAADRRPHQISGGQKQRCSIARALMADPQILLLDEPARGLDAPLRGELYDLLREIKIPILLVTHTLRECLDIADHMVVICDGRVVQQGPPLAVTEKPATIEQARLLGIYNILPVEIRTLDPGRNTSTLRLCDQEIQGEYVPGHLKGDRVHLLITPQQLRARPREGKAQPNEIAAKLVRGIEAPTYVYLQFEDGLEVEMPPHDLPHNEEYWVAFPSKGLRIL